MADLTFAEYAKLAAPLIAGQGAATAAVVKVFWNGSTKRIREMHEDLKEVRADVKEARAERAEIKERLVRVETIVDPAKEVA